MTLRLRSISTPSLLALLLLTLSACGDDGGAKEDPDGAASDVPAEPDAGGPDVPEPDVPAPDVAEPDVADTDPDAPAPVPVAPDEFFPYELARGQGISRAPFPNDLLRDGEGAVVLGPLGDDPAFGALAHAHVLARFDALVAARKGFASNGTVFFFPGAAPDLATFEGKAHYHALAGPDAGRTIAARAGWNEHVSALLVKPVYGEYLVPGTTYALLLGEGLKMADGRAIEAPAGWLDLLAAEDGDPAHADARAAYAGLRAFLAEADTAAYTVGTVFTVEDHLPYAKALFDAVDAFPLSPPTNEVSWDPGAKAFVTPEPIEGADLDLYFGVPSGDFVSNPGVWSEGARADAGVLSGADEPYDGGTYHAGIGRVVHGSFRAPAFHLAADGATNVPIAWADGKATWEVESVVPFTLFLCESQLADPTDLPVAIFTHGGTAIRADAIAAANLNCLLGIATVCFDLPFHGGRTATVLGEDGVRVLPTHPDLENVFTGLDAEDEAYVPDRIGDDAGAVPTVGAMFGLAYDADPAIVEANLLSIATDTYTLVRLVKEGDWSQVAPGVSFDAERVFHESLSFGTTFTTVLMAGRDAFRGVVSSVGTGAILSENLLMAPNNANLAAGVLVPTLGAKTPAFFLLQGAWREPVIALEEWLLERGDSLPYAPFVLRHRGDDFALPILSSGDSWDETLYTPAQLGYNHAYGFEVRTAGAEFTLDPTVFGASTVTAAPFGAEPLSGNVTYGNRTATAVVTYFHEACHGELLTPVCARKIEGPTPPSTKKAVPLVFESPICAWHGQAKGFLASLLTGTEGEAGPPEGTCDELYGAAP